MSIARAMGRSEAFARTLLYRRVSACPAHFRPGTNLETATGRHVLPFSEDPLRTVHREQRNVLGKQHYAKLDCEVRDGSRKRKSLRQQDDDTTDSKDAQIAALRKDLKTSRRSRGATAAKARRLQERSQAAPKLYSYEWIVTHPDKCRLYTSLAADVFPLFVEQLECCR